MAKTTVFRSGKSCAVRIPRGIRLPEGELEIFQGDEEVVIRARRDTLADIPDLLARLPEDFMFDGIRDEPPQRRRHLQEYLAGVGSPFELGKDLFGRHASGRRKLVADGRKLYVQVTNAKRRARG